MDLGLAGRRVLLLGAGGAIGQAVVAALQREGAEITLVSHRPPPASTSTTWLTADLAIAAQRQRVIEAVLARPPEAMISLAAMPVIGRISSDQDDQLNRAMSIKVWGPAAIAEAVGPKMAEAGWGRIVLTSGFAGREPLSDYLHGVTNAGIRNLVKSISARWAAHGVTVNAVAPGPVRSDRLDRWRAVAVGERHPLAKGGSALPRGRDLEPEEIAGVIVFVASVPASGLNGTEVVVDGGATLGI